MYRKPIHLLVYLFANNWKMIGRLLLIMPHTLKQLHGN